jgi:hypothetical protein
MIDILVPSWIQHRKERGERESLQAGAEFQKSRAAALSIATFAPKLWKSLVKELDLTARGLIHLDIRASLSAVAQSDSEEHILIDLAKDKALIANVGYVDIAYRSQIQSIYVFSSWGRTTRLSFRVQDETVSLMADDGFRLMDVEESARYIGEMVADHFCGI